MNKPIEREGAEMVPGLLRELVDASTDESVSATSYIIPDSPQLTEWRSKLPIAGSPRVPAADNCRG
ncbi:hypothetical protein GCM10027184_20650 [Saccharothrix stipae]